MKQNREAVAKESPNLAVYAKRAAMMQADTPSRKRFFGRSKKQGPTPRQIREFLHQWMHILPGQEAQMLDGVFRLATTSAREIMTPLADMFAVPTGTRIDHIKPMIRELDYSYVPVYEDRIDRLTGIVRVMDLLYAKDGTEDMGGLIRSAYYIPETKNAADLLGELRSAEDPIALVIDEYASCVGLVTLEDIVEQIVGQIGPFEHGPASTIEATSPSSWVMDARTDVGAVARTIGISIPRDRCDTVGGFVMKLFGRLPEQGEEIQYDGVTFTIASVFDYGISEIQITRPEFNESKRRKR